jgi:hypothetical protein
MKHPYDVSCQCARCARERARRNAQGTQTRAVQGLHRAMDVSARRQARWARETRRERARAEWAINDDGPGDYEMNGPDQDRDIY